MTDVEKNRVLDKIQKILNLAESSSEHEASVALDIAKKLMLHYQIDTNDLELAHVKEFASKLKFPLKRNEWQVHLLWVIANYFNCFWYSKGKQIFFYGLDYKAEIAAYVFDCVYPKLLKARRLFLQKSRCRTLKSRQTRVNIFSKGWIDAISKRLEINFPQVEKDLLNRYSQEKLDLATVTARKNIFTKIKDNDYYKIMLNGIAEGEKIDILNAMHGKERAKLQIY